MSETQVRNSRKVRVGEVTSVAGAKTGEASLGDTVRVMETRPLSKTKRWRLVEIVEKAE